MPRTTEKQCPGSCNERNEQKSTFFWNKSDWAENSLNRLVWILGVFPESLEAGALSETAPEQYLQFCHRVPAYPQSNVTKLANIATVLFLISGRTRHYSLVLVSHYTMEPILTEFGVKLWPHKVCYNSVTSVCKISDTSSDRWSSWIRVFANKLQTFDRIVTEVWQAFCSHI